MPLHARASFACERLLARAKRFIRLRGSWRAGQKPEKEVDDMKKALRLITRAKGLR